jgi:hypothetical protein
VGTVFKKRSPVFVHSERKEVLAGALSKGTSKGAIKMNADSGGGIVGEVSFAFYSAGKIK